METNEGFVLFIEVDENNNVDDTVLISNRVTLVTIRDNDGEGFAYNSHLWSMTLMYSFVSYITWCPH